MEKIIRPKLVPKLQRQITNDWLALFPSFKKDATASISRRVGPILISIWYDRPSGNDRYRICSSIRNLTETHEVIGLDLRYEPFYKYGSISWNQHEQGKYKEAAVSLRENTPIPLQGPVTLSQVLGAYLAPKVGGIVEFDAPALIAAWAGKMELADRLLEWGREKYELLASERRERNKERIAEGIPASRLSEITDDEIQEWYDNLKKRLEDPDKIRSTVASELERHGLTKIPYEALIIDDFNF